MTTNYNENGRRPRAVEREAGGVYFAPEAHAAYQELGIDARPPVADSFPRRLAGTYNVGGEAHVGSGLTIDTAAELHQADR